MGTRIRQTQNGRLTPPVLVCALGENYGRERPEVDLDVGADLGEAPRPPPPLTPLTLRLPCDDARAGGELLLGRPASERDRPGLRLEGAALRLPASRPFGDRIASARERRAGGAGLAEPFGLRPADGERTPPPPKLPPWRLAPLFTPGSEDRGTTL